MRRLILEQRTFEPKNTNDFPIKKHKGTSFAMDDNLLIMQMDFSGKLKWVRWDEYTDTNTYINDKKLLYGINRGESMKGFLERKRTEKNSGTNVKTKGKCSPLTTPPAGLTLNITNPGDKNYVYGKVGEEWFAQNIKNKKIFNLTKCNYTTSIAKLEKIKPGSTNASVEQLQSQSKEIQQSAGLPETGSFDIQSLEKLIKLLSDEEQPKVQSVNQLKLAGIQTPNAEEQLKQIASQQTIRQ